MKIKEIKTKIKSKYYLMKENLYWNKVLGPTFNRDEATVFETLSDAQKFMMQSPYNSVVRFYLMNMRIVKFDE